MKKLLLLLGLSLTLATPAFADQQELEAAIAGKHRTPTYAARDEHRHPLQTLTLFDVQPNHTVVEIWPGGGWYTEILASFVIRSSACLLPSSMRRNGNIRGENDEENSAEGGRSSGSQQFFAVLCLR